MVKHRVACMLKNHLKVLIKNQIFYSDIYFHIGELHVDHPLVFSLRGRVGRNQRPVMWPVRLWHTASCNWIHVQLNFQHNMCLNSTKFTLFVTLTQTTVLKSQHNVTINTNSISQAFINVSRQAVGNYWTTKYCNKINNLITSSEEASKQTTSWN